MRPVAPRRPAASPRAPTPAAGRALAEAFGLESSGRLRDAVESFDRATDIDPECGLLWRHRGNLLRKIGELGAAAACFERAIVHGDDPVLNAFFLSAVGVGPVAATAPATFVGALFDQYADRFDAHLLDRLAYRAPLALAGLVAEAGQPPFDSAIDLGCGTGLAGAAFRPFCHRLAGVDLSARMIERARRRLVYDSLVQGDLLAALEQVRHASLHLAVCCDTLIYVGDLSPVFARVERALRCGGSFAFTVETCEAESGFDLLPSLRYSHSERYLRGLAGEHGLAVQAIRAETLRAEEDAAVVGLLVHMVRT